MKSIGMSFPGVRALDSVSFDLYPGEISRVGRENGAGKSTLMKTLGASIRLELRRRDPDQRPSAAVPQCA